MIRRLAKQNCFNARRVFACNTRTSSVMASVSINGASVPVTCADTSIDLGRVISSKPFRDWTGGIDEELVIKDVNIQNVDMFGSRVGFIKFVANAEFHGRRIPGVVFMRGGAVSVLPILHCDGKKWVLCVVQPRIPCGKSANLEIPAGMMDDEGHFSGVAAKELKEETGIDIKYNEMIDLTALAYDIPTPKLDATTGGPSSAASSPVEPSSAELRGIRGMYPSVGACDEFLRLMYYSVEVTREYLDGLKGKATGNIEEGEVITLEVLPYDELWRRAPGSKELASILLYEKLLAQGRIPEITASAETAAGMAGKAVEA